MNAYLFDVDGVLNNLQREVNQHLIEQLSQILIDGEPLCLVSGRSFDYQIEDIVKPIEKCIEKQSHDYKHIIENLFVSGEFGGVNVVHKNGERISNKDETVSIPASLRQAMNVVFAEFSDLLFVEKKLTMVTAAIIDPNTSVEFEERKPEIIAACKEKLREYPDFYLLHDRFSVNIKHKKATKSYATAQVVDWITGKGFKPKHYYAFGDSISDLEIGEELFARKLPMEFIFVGRKEEIDGQKIHFPYTVTNQDFDLGTIEFFTNK